MEDAPKTLIELRQVAKSYGGVEILHDVDFVLRDGEFMTVLGPSGSGKTTILRILARLIKPFAGSVLLDGADIAGIRTATSTAPTSPATSAGT
ncbi:MAG: ABC transporter ATP-binding protein, partial [Propionibacteriaceae bacterium]|nr:ABC transporter ATP-binding protein [Propionibacteriaceae bacterium]